MPAEYSGAPAGGQMHRALAGGLALDVQRDHARYSAGAGPDGAVSREQAQVMPIGKAREVFWGQARV